MTTYAQSDAAERRRRSLDRTRKRLLATADGLLAIREPALSVVQVLHELACTRCPPSDGYALYKNCAVWSALRVAWVEGLRYRSR